MWVGLQEAQKIKVMDNVNHPLSVVCHYTALPSLDSILTDTGVKLRATRYGFFSDKQEFVWAKEKIYPKLKDIATQNGEMFEPDHQVHPYILSFSELEDDLNMWRLYANEGKGVCLIFDRAEIERMQSGNTCAMSVVYANEQNLLRQIEHTKQIYHQCIPNADVVDDYRELPAFIKKEEYGVEQEFRLAKYLYDGLTAEYDPEMPDNCRIKAVDEIPDTLIKFRTRGDMLVPYIEIVLPKVALKGVCIGYDCDGCSVEKVVELMLLQHGYKDVEITQSLINKI